MVALKNSNGEFYFAKGLAAEAIFHIELMRDKGWELRHMSKSEKYPRLSFRNVESALDINIVFDDDKWLMRPSGLMEGYSAAFLSQVIVPFLELLNNRADVMPWKFLGKVYGLEEEE